MQVYITNLDVTKLPSAMRYTKLQYQHNSSLVLTATDVYIL